MTLRRIGLTGATGMVGRHFLSLLKDRGVEAVPVSKDGRIGTSWNLRQWLEFDQLDSLFPGVDAIVHAGAIIPTSLRPVTPGEMFDVNVRSCLCLGEWALSRGVPLAFVSSGSIYPDIESIGITETTPIGNNSARSDYSLSKVMAEQIFDNLACRGLRRIIFRPSSLYGSGLPGDKLIPRFLATAAAGGTLRLSSPVGTRIDFVHAADLCRSIFGALAADISGIFNISSERPTSMIDLAEACIAASGGGSILVDGTEEEIRPTGRLLLDCAKARREFAYSPVVSLDLGLVAMARGDVVI